MHAGLIGVGVSSQSGRLNAAVAFEPLKGTTAVIWVNMVHPHHLNPKRVACHASGLIAKRFLKLRICGASVREGMLAIPEDTN